MTAPAITLSDYRAVYDAKYGRPQKSGGEGVGQMRTGGGPGGAYEKGSFFADILYGRPLIFLRFIGVWRRNIAEVTCLG